MRSTRSREPESNRFSWDPNSRNSSSRASSKNKRDPSRDNSRSGSVTHSPKISPEFGGQNSRPSPSRLSPGSGGGVFHCESGGNQIQQDLRVESRLASSVARSASLEFGNNGGKLRFISNYIELTLFLLFNNVYFNDYPYNKNMLYRVT